MLAFFSLPNLHLIDITISISISVSVSSDLAIESPLGLR
jgi:hypothetical protein